MLPAGLLRAKVTGRAIAPSVITLDKPAIRTVTAHLLTLFNDAVAAERRLGDVLADLDALCAERRDHRMVRGLAHLLRRRCTLSDPGVADPAALRADVFRRAAAAGPLSLAAGPFARPIAADVLGAIAEEQASTPAALLDALYADHEHERRITSRGLPDATWLVDRYNTALAQGLLRSAREVVVRLEQPTSPRMRQLFRWVKFHQLLHRAHRDEPTLTLVLDGPMSMFSGATRYGQQLARFLPALLLQDGEWRLSATVEWTRARHPKDLVITSEDGLVSHYADTGAYHNKTQQHLATQFDGAGEWTLEEGQEPLTLGPKIVVYPDFTLTSGDRVAHLEVWGHWRPEALQARLEALSRYGPPHLIVAVPKKLASGRDKALPDHPQLLAFSELIPARSLRAAADRVATVAPVVASSG